MILTVTQINRYISFKLKEDRNLQGIMVKGEISNFTDHYRSGHLYFTLKDGESSVKAVMFASAASRLRFRPEDGINVVASGNVSVFERDGVYQLCVGDMQIASGGKGTDYAALQMLKEKLSKEGLFDTAHKRPLPLFPKKIGFVTSAAGAAVQDVINVLSRRYPLCELIVADSQVQGAGAADSVCRGILKAQNHGCDVIIVGRGGGCTEDLAAFNTEKVAYAIYNCKVPVISAVGHETDFTVSDLTADVRAATPSAAAELTSPSKEHLTEQIDALIRRFDNALLKVTDAKTNQLINVSARLLRFSPENRLKMYDERLKTLEYRLKTAVNAKTERCAVRLNENLAKLDSLSPVKVLSRGYSLVYKDSKLVNNAACLKDGDLIGIRFGKGEVTACVRDTANA